MFGDRLPGKSKIRFLGKGIVGYARYMKFKHDLNITQTNHIVQRRLEVVTFFDKYSLNATVDAFRVSKSSIYLWRKVLKDHKQDITYLIPKSTKPKHTRRMVIDGRVLSFIRNLRVNNYRLGKEKIKPLLDMYCKDEDIPGVSESLIGKIIKRNNINFRNLAASYKNPNSDVFRRKSRKKPRLRISKDFKSGRAGELVQIDTIVRFDLGTKRYILTAIDLFSRFSFAFAYSTLSSRVALDFVKKLQIVFPLNIKAVKTDNGLEFLGEFEDYLVKKNINHFFSYPRTPKSNAFVERFNRSIQEEFVDYNVEYLFETQIFNQKLMDYLLYYNQIRPHKSLDNQTPLGYLVSKGIISQMCVTSTSA